MPRIVFDSYREGTCGESKHRYKLCQAIMIPRINAFLDKEIKGFGAVSSARDMNALLSYMHRAFDLLEASLQLWDYDSKGIPSCPCTDTEIVTAYFAKSFYDAKNDFMEEYARIRRSLNRNPASPAVYRLFPIFSAKWKASLVNIRRSLFIDLPESRLEDDRRSLRRVLKAPRFTDIGRILALPEGPDSEVGTGIILQVDGLLWGYSGFV